MIKRGSKPDVEAWVATGRSGVLTLREAVTGGSGRMALEGVHDRDVLDGLATASAATRNKDLRMHAAIGLGRRPVPDARTALKGLLTDPDFLVRHHASRSLAALDGIDQPSGEVDEASIG